MSATTLSYPAGFVDFVTFRNVKDSTPKAERWSYAQFVERLSRHDEREFKDGPLFSTAIYEPGTTRANQNVQKLTAGVFDIDHGCYELTIEKLEQYAWSAYSTFNFTEEDQRFRLVIFFDKPLPAAMWKAVEARINYHLLQSQVDRGTNDESRAFYWPAAKPDALTFFKYHPGELLDPLSLPDVPTTKAPQKTAVIDGEPDRPLGRAALEFAAFGAEMGVQRKTGCAVARDCCACGLPVEKATELIWKGFQASKQDPSDPWTYEHAVSIARDIYAKPAPPLAPLLTISLNGHLSSGVPAISSNGAGAPSTPVAAPSITLPELIAVFKQWLDLPDVGGLEAILAGAVANQMPGDPVWLLLISPPSGGKTEQLQPLTVLPHIFPTATLTEGALLSGTSKRDKSQDAKGGLLRAIGDFGILLLKDFGGILSLNKDTRGAILQALREIYDGSWTRHVGTDGGKTLHWQGKVGLLGGATPAIDAHHAVMAILGERFCFYRLPDPDAETRAKQALSHFGREGEMRAALAGAVRGFFAGLSIPDEAPRLSEAEVTWLVALASFVARARSAVIRDSHTREVELVAGAEVPSRLVLVLARMLGALQVIGVPTIERYTIIQKIGLDSMPQLRRHLIEFLAGEGVQLETPQVAEGVRHPTNTTRRALEDLHSYGIVERLPGHTDKWWLSDWATGAWKQVNIVPESREGMHCAEAGARGLYYTNTPTDSISGTSCACLDCNGPLPADRPLATRCDVCVDKQIEDYERLRSAGVAAEVSQ